VKHLRTLSLGKNAPTRRQLLKALGVSAAAAPLIPSLDGWAAPGGPAKRLLLVFTPDGTVPERWYPQGTETAFTFPGANHILAPLAKHQKDMIFFKDIPRHNGGSGGAHEHGMGGLWTGNSIAGNQNMAPSVDQIIAKTMPKQTDFQSLQFGVQSYYLSGDANAKTASVNSYMIYSGPKAQMPAEADPYKMFDRIFGGFSPPTPAAGGGAPKPDPNNDRIRAEKQSILDFIKADITDVRLKVGKEDGAKIDAHLETVRDIERRLTSAPDSAVLAGCSPQKGQMFDLNKNESFPMLIPLTNKMVAAAFACDRTRIASLQLSRGFSNHIHSWLGAKETHHTISHGAGNAGILGNIQAWYMNHISGLLDELTNVQEAGKPMLDNMLVVYGNELYLGWTHGVSPEPTWWAGKLGGTVKSTGRFLDYAGKYNWNQMLTTIARAFGVMVDKVGDLGTPGFIPDLLV
jgi:uncharacterized protein DUF1552